MEKKSQSGKKEKARSGANGIIKCSVNQTPQEHGHRNIFHPTGVKYLHEKAAQYDIGIEFEANGHRTVLFSDQFLEELELTSKKKSRFDYVG